MKKRLLSTILSLVMLLGLMSAVSITTSAGSAGIKNNGLDGININIYAAPYTTFANKPYGENAYTNVGCAWFASARVNQLTGKGNTIYSGSSWYNSAYANYGFTRGQEVRAKALACYSGHVAVVEKVNGNTVTISEGGSGYSDAAHDYCIIRHQTVSEVKTQTSGFLGFVYLGTVPSTKPSVTGAKVSNVTNNTARFDFTINNPSQVSVPECGAQIRLPGGSWATHTESIVSNHRTLASIPAWYTVGSGQEFSYTLQPGTTYEMRGYCKYNGETFYSNVVTFTTISDKKDISSCSFSILSQYYDGNAKTPNVDIRDGDKILTKGVDYSVTYSNNINPGTATATINGLGNYKGTKTVSFIIHQCTFYLPPYKDILTKTSGTINVYTDLEDNYYMTALLVPSGTRITNWKSSNPDVMSVTSKGEGLNAATLEAKSYGKVTISCTVTYGKVIQNIAENYIVRYYDVPDESVSGFNEIYWAADNGITKGYNNGEYFGPTKECTRQEFAIFLWRTMGQPDPKGTNLPFSDVSGMTDAGKKAVSWAVKNGIIQGFDDNTFRPNSKVTREQIVIMLWRTAGKPAANKALSFSDTKNYSKTSTSYKAMSWASEKEIIYGFDDNTFRPKDNSKRNQIVIMLYRYVNNK